MSFGLEQLTIMTFGTSKYAVNKVKLYCIYLEVYFNMLCLSICSVWRCVGTLGLTELEQIQTHVIGWENNERGKISLADRDTDIQKVLGWKQKSFEIQSWLKDLPSSLRQRWMLLLSQSFLCPWAGGWRCMLRPPISGRSSAVPFSEPQQGRQQSCSEFTSYSSLIC